MQDPRHTADGERSARGWRQAAVRRRRRGWGALSAVTLALLLTGACGGRPEPAAGSAELPLALPQAGVLAWFSVQRDAQVRAELLDTAVGFSPEGLDPDRPLLLLHLDARTLGGSFAALLPLVDAQAFHASLTETDVLESLGRGRWRLNPRPGSGPSQLLAGLQFLISGSLSGMMDALGGGAAGAVRLPDFEIAVHEDWALLAPSFESRTVLRAVLQDSPALARAPRNSLRAGLDIGRLEVVHAEELASLHDRVMGLTSGTMSGAALGRLALLTAGGHFAGEEGLRINAEVLRALVQLVLVGSPVTAMRLEWTGPDLVATPDGDALEPDSGWRPAESRFSVIADLDTRHAPARALAALRPLPAEDGLSGAAFTLSASAADFAEAFAEWLRPLGEVVKGRGPPCDRWLAELRRLIAGWGGWLAVTADESGPLLVFDSGSSAVTARDTLDWLAPLLATARVRDLPLPLSLVETGGGGLQFVDASGAVLLQCGQRGAVTWVGSPGRSGVAEAALDVFERAALAAPQATGPALRVSVERLPLQATVSVTGSRLHLELAPRETGTAQAAPPAGERDR